MMEKEKRRELLPVMTMLHNHQVGTVLPRWCSDQEFHQYFNKLIIFDSGLLHELPLKHSFRALHRFGQAKFPDGGSIFNTEPASPKNCSIQSGQN